MNALPRQTGQACFAAVTATGLLGGGALFAMAVTAAEAESILPLHRRFLELQAASATLDTLPDEARDEAWDRAQDATRELMDRSLMAVPTTLAGAVAALAWARWEFGRHYIETVDEPDWMGRWTLAMMDAALGVLRRDEAGVAA